jgi:hypothetical protein
MGQQVGPWIPHGMHILLQLLWMSDQSCLPELGCYSISATPELLFQAIYLCQWNFHSSSSLSALQLWNNAVSRSHRGEWFTTMSRKRHGQTFLKTSMFQENLRDLFPWNLIGASGNFSGHQSPESICGSTTTIKQYILLQVAGEEKSESFRKKKRIIHLAVVYPGSGYTQQFSLQFFFPTLPGLSRIQDISVTPP